MGAIFGPAGESVSFKNEKNVSLLQYLNNFGLKAYEYQCGRGVRISKERARQFAKELPGIYISVHAPYYISLSSLEEQKRINSVKYILNTAKVAKSMGAKRIVVHSGSCANLKRKDALDLAKDTLKAALMQLKEEGITDVHICPETMGKSRQLGDLNEVIELCKLDESMLPCIDFGHLNARTFGSLKSEADYLAVLDFIENELGFYRLSCFHSHFSKVEYTVPGGEKRHLTFRDRIFGPSFEPLASAVVKKGVSPIFICESAGTQAEDAKSMKDIYSKMVKNI